MADGATYDPGCFAVARGNFVNRKRILLADDHAEMLDEVRALLDKDYEIVGAVQDGKQLVQAASDLNPDLIISDNIYFRYYWESLQAIQRV